MNFRGFRCQTDHRGAQDCSRTLCHKFLLLRESTVTS